jgi:predicted small secreted protein
MTPRIRIVVAVTAASMLLLAGCSTTTRGFGTEAEPAGVAEAGSSSPDFGSPAASSPGGAVAGAKTTAQLQGGLVAGTDLGTGWVVNPDDSDDSDDDGTDDCGSDVDLPAANRAGIEFDDDGTAAFFVEEVGSAASEPAAQAAYAAIVATYQACSTQTESDGSVLTLTPAAVPKLGDDSTGFTATATSAGISLGGNLALVRDGRLVEFFFLLYQADSPASGFAGYLTTAVTKAHSLR